MFWIVYMVRMASLSESRLSTYSDFSLFFRNDKGTVEYDSKDYAQSDEDE